MITFDNTSMFDGRGKAAIVVLARERRLSQSQLSKVDNDVHDDTHSMQPTESKKIIQLFVSLHKHHKGIRQMNRRAACSNTMQIAQIAVPSHYTNARPNQIQ